LAVTLQVLLRGAVATFGPDGQVFFGDADGGWEFLVAVPGFGDAGGQLPVVQQAWTSAARPAAPRSAGVNAMAESFYSPA
jgi:hypothetical protein